MENKDENYTCGHCACNCSGMHGRKHWMWRKVLYVALLLIAFCFGSAWGELKGEVRSMRYHGGYGMMGGKYMLRGDDMPFNIKFQKMMDDAESGEELPVPAN